MAEMTLADGRPDMVAWGEISLNQSLVNSLILFLGTPRNKRSKTEWFACCMERQAAGTFFKGHRDNDTSRLTACKLVADAYEELRDQKEVAIIKPSLVVKVQAKANTLRTSLPAPQYLPGDAITKEFRDGLDSLCRWSTPVTAPTSKSGNACARAFTLTLAEKFADAFVDIPVEYIHSLVTIGWPGRSLSATWRVLNADVTLHIKRENESNRVLASSADTAAFLAIQSASTTRHVMSGSDVQVVEQLQEEMERVRQGKRRFPSDAARLRGMLEIVQTLHDTGLADEFSNLIANHLQEFRWDSN